MMLSEKQPADPVQLQPETIRDRFGIHFPYSRFLCAILDCDLPFRVGMDERTLSEQIKPVAAKWLYSHGECLEYGRQTMYYLLLNFPAEQGAAVRSDLAGFFSECLELHDIYGEFRMHLALSDIQEKAVSIPEVIRQARLTLWGRFVQPGDQIVRYDRLRLLEHKDEPELYSGSALKTLGEGIRCKNIRKW